MQSKPHAYHWRVLLRSAALPLHLGLLILSLLLLTDRPVAAYGLLGLLGYLALLWRDARSPEFIKWALGGEGDPEGDDPVRLPQYRACVAQAEAARQRIHAAIDQADPSLARVIAPIKVQVSQVLLRLSPLVERAQSIDAFLSREKREYIEKSLQELEQTIAASSDDFTRDQYLQARRSRAEQLGDYDELTLCLERVRAQITNVLSNLEGAEAKVMKLQTADLPHAGTVSDTVTRSLQALSQEMTSFQESIDATMALRTQWHNRQ